MRSPPEARPADAGIDRRTLLAAALAALAVGKAGVSTETEIVVVDGWILSPRDLAPPSPVRAG